jgi:LysM repeat protein
MIHLLPTSLPLNYHPTTLLTQFELVAPGEIHTLLFGIASLPEEFQKPTAPTSTPTPTEIPVPIPTSTPTPTPLTPTATPALTPTSPLTALPPTPTETPTPTATPITEEEYCTYTIKSGDTLSKIASRFTGESRNYRQIMEFNGSTSDAIRVGDQLNIPNSLLLEEYQDCEFEPQTPEWTKLVGRVFFDKNRNEQYDENEPLLETFHAIFSHKLKTRGKEGKFIFSHIEPGEHTIEILYGQKVYSTTVTLHPGHNEHNFPLRFTGIKITVREAK